MSGESNLFETIPCLIEKQIERDFSAWRDAEVDETGTIPQGYEKFRAGYRLALSAADGRHDHIEDGSTYLDCIACGFTSKESSKTQIALERAAAYVARVVAERDEALAKLTRAWEEGYGVGYEDQRYRKAPDATV